MSELKENMHPWLQTYSSEVQPTYAIANFAYIKMTNCNDCACREFSASCLLLIAPGGLPRIGTIKSILLIPIQDLALVVKLKMNFKQYFKQDFTFFKVKLSQ